MKLCAWVVTSDRPLMDGKMKRVLQRDGKSPTSTGSHRRQPCAAADPYCLMIAPCGSLFPSEETDKIQTESLLQRAGHSTFANV